MRRMHRNRALAWVWLPLLLTVSVRVAWLSAFPTEPIAPVDAEGFHLLAVNVLDGKGFAIGWDPPLCPTAVRTPLYPWFVAGVYSLLGRDPQRVVLVQTLLEVLTTAGAMALTSELATAAGTGRSTKATHVRTAMFLAGVLYAINGTTQRFTGYLFSEALLLPLMPLALILTLRSLRCPPRRSALGRTSFREQRPDGDQRNLKARSGFGQWISVLFTVVRDKTAKVCVRMGRGLSVRPAMGRSQAFASMLTYTPSAAIWGLILLIKPNGQYLVLAVGVLVTVRLYVVRRSLQGRWLCTAGAFWAVLMLVLLPWLVRNRLLLGRWTLSTAFDENVARVSAVATQAALQSIEVKPWSETWEYLYRTLELQAVPELAGVPAKELAPCALQMAWQRRIADAALTLVAANAGPYLRVHLQGVLRSLLDPGHRFWYRVITGQDWVSTGVVPDIWQRMAWSLKQWAVGDALEALWLARVWRIPPLAGVLWWGLVAGRVAVGQLAVRSVWRLRSAARIARDPWAALLLAGTVGYHILLPGPIAYDRFYAPVVPVVVALIAYGAARRYPQSGETTDHANGSAVELVDL